MKSETMLQELEAVAEALEVVVSYEALSASVGLGGLCRVKGRLRVIIDKRASLDERVTTLAEALAGLDTSGVTASPALRRLLEHYAPRRAS